MIGLREDDDWFQAANSFFSAVFPASKAMLFLTDGSF